MINTQRSVVIAATKADGVCEQQPGTHGAQGWPPMCLAVRAALASLRTLLNT
jgi:hypothetical protein